MNLVLPKLAIKSSRHINNAAMMSTMIHIHASVSSQLRSSNQLLLIRVDTLAIINSSTLPLGRDATNSL